MRDGFARAIQELGKNHSFFILTGDHGYALFDDFKVRYPEQFINVGVAESNMVAMAAGMAREGLKVMIYGLASFVPNRVYEFLKLQIALDALPVTVVGDGGGLVYSTLGHSHQSLDDLSLATSLPNFQVFSPSSDPEAEALTRALANLSVPSYIRLGKSGGSYSGGFPQDKIEPYIVKSSNKAQALVILSHGFMLSRVLELDEAGLIPDAQIWSVPTIAPLTNKLVNEINSSGKVIIVEEHLVHGGLGTIVQSQLSMRDIKVRVLGASKDFHKGVGSHQWVLAERGLSSESLVNQIHEFTAIN